MYRGAVIGYGGMGKRHAELLDWLSTTQLVAVCDTSPKARAEAQRRYEGIATYDTVAELFERERLDVVAIATHASFHAEPALLAAEHGVHVICEKPIASSLAEADRMVDAFEKRKLLLAVNHQWRLGPGVERAAEMIGEGAIGEFASIHVNFGKGRPAGYELAEMGTHVFDIVCKFAGAPTLCVAHILHENQRATAQDVMRGSELLPRGRDCGLVAGTAIAASFQFESGLLVCAEAFQAPEMKDRRILVDMRGAKGRLRLVNGKFGDLYYAKGAYSEDGSEDLSWEKVATRGFDSEPGLSEMANTMLPVYRRLLVSIETGRPHPCNGGNARLALEMISSVFVSHFTEAPVSIPLADRGDFLGDLKAQVVRDPLRGNRLYPDTGVGMLRWKPTRSWK